MKALKGLMIYIGIVLGSLLGLALILLCVMYFVPTFRIAGIGFVHTNDDVEEQVIDISKYSGYSDIVVNLSTNKIGIKVLPVETKDITFEMNLGVFGLTSEIVEYKIIKSVTCENGVLEIFLNVTEPNGWVSIGNSCLTLKVPTSKVVGVVALTKTGSITVGAQDLAISINDLNVTTTRGDLNLINLGKGSEEKNLTLSTMSLSTGSGTFDLSDIDNLTVLNTIKLESDNGRFKFKNLYASVNITGNGVTLEAEQISCGEKGFSFIANNGIFRIKKLSSPDGAENTIIAENISEFEIDNITGKTGIVTTYGDIEIDQIRDYTIIENEYGSVGVKTANNTIIITTKFGDINVDAYYGIGKFTSQKGRIHVKSQGEFADEYFTQINNIDGDVVVYNKVNRLLLTTTGRANVDVTFGSIKEGKIFQHKINTNTQGNCIVYMPTVNVPAYSYVAKGIISGEIGIGIDASNNTQYYPDSSFKNAALNNCSFEFVGRITFKGYSQLTQ